MIPPTFLSRAGEIVYPESDGKPMADNTKQFQWIVILAGNLAALFRGRDDVFVGGNLMWYPVQGEPETCNAPDVFVAFGRPKGHRGSYKQWEENNVPMTVVFEIMSPGNTGEEIDDKQDFYEVHGVAEYYLYNPESNRLKVFVRQGDVLRRIRPAHGFVSPRLGIRFDLSSPEMVVTGPSGKRFLTFEELTEAREEDKKLSSRMAELSRKARRGQASAEELKELERLEDQSSPPSS